MSLVRDPLRVGAAWELLAEYRHLRRDQLPPGHPLGPARMPRLVALQVLSRGRGPL